MRETAVCKEDERQMVLLAQIEEYVRRAEEDRVRQQQIDVDYEIMREQADVEMKRLQERVDQAYACIETLEITLQ